MNPAAGLRFLRPRLHSDLSPARKAAHLRFSSTSQFVKRYAYTSRKIRNLNAYKHYISDGIEFRGEVQERIKELQAANALEWPRIKSDKEAMRIEEFLAKYDGLERG